MPFPMVHLSIACTLLKDMPFVRKPSDFYLGAVAPDSVHFRLNYHSGMKKESHLCIGEEKWGQVTNNDEWMESVLGFLAANRETTHLDFILGYCSHILADIQNNIKIWIPFRSAHEVDLTYGSGSLLHKEAAAIDFKIYREHPERQRIWDQLEKSESIDIPGQVNSLDIDAMKTSLLYEQFENREYGNPAEHECLTYQQIVYFMTETSAFIKSVLLSAL